MVQHGLAERSFVRYVDIILDDPREAESLISGGHVHLVHDGSARAGSTPVSLDGLLHAVAGGIELDFGPGGIGGNAGSSAADGSYEISVDGTSTRFTFGRLLGDLNGDGKVDKRRLELVSPRGHATADANGDGILNAKDRQLVSHALGRRLQPLSTVKKPPTHATTHSSPGKTFARTQHTMSGRKS